MDTRKIAVAFSKGVCDSFTGAIRIFYLDKEIQQYKLTYQSPSRSNVRQKESTPTKQVKRNGDFKIWRRVAQCSILNGLIFLFSILLFEYGALPALNYLMIIFHTHSVWTWIEPMLKISFETVWVIPLFIICKIVNSLIFQDIADFAYKHTRGRPVYSLGLSKVAADSLFSVVIQILFLLQATLVSYVPIYMIGYILSGVHMCMLYSLYAFEYKWVNMGWELHKRLTFIETNWPYFVGFGLPLTLATQLTQSWTKNACIFSLLFPVFIISGNEAKPVTYACDYDLHFFSPVISISNLLFRSTIGNPKSNVPQANQIR